MSVIPFFSLFNCKFLLENKLIDIFPNRFSFHFLDRKSKNNIKSHLHNLENVSFQLSSDLYISIFVSDANIKNNVATLIAYIYTHNNLFIKTIHYAVNITSTEVKIFAL